MKKYGTANDQRVDTSDPGEGQGEHPEALRREANRKPTPEEVLNEGEPQG